MSPSDEPARPERAAHIYAPYVSALHARLLARGLDDPAADRWQADAGTLVFFDVSGFTPLTERLAARGKVGAEELTDLLNTIFGSLLAAAGEFGGDTLKFGGDALLLHFDGPGHEARACAAAWAMQQVMRRTRRLRTSVGTVSLGASCGVASGPVHVFLVGEVFRELVVAGPTTSSTLEMEQAARSGEILVAPSTAAALPAGLLGHAEGGGGRALLTSPNLRDAPPLDPPAPSPRLADCAAGGLQPALLPYLQFTADGEHRQVGVAFLQVLELDRRIAAGTEPEAWAALHDLVVCVQDHCERHAITFLGTDCDRGATKVMLTVGAPASGSHDADQLLLALASILATELELTIRAGANHGRVFAVHLGAEHRRTYTTMGEATNLAARVMGKAPPGRVLATTAILDRSTAPLGIEPVEPFAVKGVSAPVTGAYLGGAAADGVGRIARAEGPLVGRDEEMRLLRGLIDRAAGGRAGAIELVGEPGIGKSRLLQEAARTAEARGLTVVRVAGRPYDADRVYASVREPLRTLIAGGGSTDDAVRRAIEARLDDRAIGWLPLVSIPFGLSLPPTAEQRALSPTAARARLHLELLPVLGGVVEPGTLVAIEDTQWIDEASRELLQMLLTAPGVPPTATVLTSRDPPRGLRPPATTTVELLPLAPLAIDALIAHDADVRAPLPPAVAQVVAERAHGHPLFLEELLAAAHAGKDLEALPDSVEALITERIDVLAPADRALLREAAVLGVRFRAPLLGKMAGIPADRLDPALDRLTDFVEPDDEIHWTFRQTLAHDAAYEALPYRRRQALHRRAAELIEEASGDEVAGAAHRLSLHADAAGDHERSWRFSRIAAEQAELQGAPVEAAVYLQRALAAARHLPQLTPATRSEVAQRLGDMCELAGLYDRADPAYREARRLATGDPARQADLCRRQGWLRERTGSYSQALAWYSRGLKLLEGRGGVTSTRLRGRLVLAYGAARLRQGRLVEAIAPLEEAITLAEQTDDRPSIAHASYLLDWAHTDLGQPQPRYREQALAIYTELGDATGLANVLNNLGVNAFFEGDWKQAEAYYERSRAARQRGGDLVRYGEALHNMGELLVDQGRLDEAEPRLRRALAMWRGAGFPVGIGVALMNLGRAAARRGQDEAAGELLARAHTELDGIGSEQMIDLRVREGEWHVLNGRTDDADEILERTRHDAARRAGAPVLLAQLDRLRGAVAAQRGDLDAAHVLLAQSLAAAQGTRYEEALSSDLLVRIERRAGRPADPMLAAEAVVILVGLGVVRIWPPPLDAGDREAAVRGVAVVDLDGAADVLAAPNPFWHGGHEG